MTCARVLGSLATAMLIPCNNDNYAVGSLVDRITQLARGVNGRRSRRPIDDHTWAYAIAECLSVDWMIGTNQVRAVLDSMLPCSPSELMAMSGVDAMLNALGREINEANKALRAERSVH